MHRRDSLSPGPAVVLPLAAAYFAASDHAAAAELFLRFPSSNKVFSFVVKTLVDHSELEIAESLFCRAADLGFKIEVRYYNALINGFCDCSRIDDGIRIMKRMLQSGVSLDVITFSTLMNALGKEGRVLGSNALFGKMWVMGLSPDVACFKILFRMFWRSQMANDAVGILRAMVCDGILEEGEVLGLDSEIGEANLGAVYKRGSIGFLML